MRRKTLWIITGMILLVLAAGVGVYLLPAKQFSSGEFGFNLASEPSPSPSPAPAYSLTGTACPYAERRPLAVMVSSDAIARPLSGIGYADIVVEMPVITGGITRLMALFQCGEASTIGSIRSARHDFIPLAQLFDAVYLHWGGSHFALDRLKGGVIDNLDALTNRYNVYYRSSRLYAPHNGFTTLDRAWQGVVKARYRQTSEFSGFPRFPELEMPTPSTTPANLVIAYPGSFRVSYAYMPETGRYIRSRAGKPEIDATTGKAIETDNVVVIRAESKQIEGQYNDINLEKGGEVVVYTAGNSAQGRWAFHHNPNHPSLELLDQAGNPLRLRPGTTWFQLVEPHVQVTWSRKTTTVP